MRIINQDRNASFDIDHIAIYIEQQTIYTVVGNKNVLLGSYDSEIKAKKVFDDIHDSYYMECRDFKMPKF